MPKEVALAKLDLQHRQRERALAQQDHEKIMFHEQQISLQQEKLQKHKVEPKKKWHQQPQQEVKVSMKINSKHNT